METKTLSSFDIAVKSVKSDDPNGEFEAVLSAPTLDRDGEIVDGRCFDPLPDRIPIDVDHGMSVLSTVGSGSPFYDGDTLKIKGTFASTPTAQEVRTLVTEGHISRMSVAFMGALRAEDEDGRPHVVKAELLNAAIVAIPSNREAAITAAKAALKVGARNSASDAQLLQAAHDAIVAAGAECEGKHAPADTTKTSTATETAEAAAPAASPPDVTVARAHAYAAEALSAL